MGNKLLIAAGLSTIIHALYSWYRIAVATAPDFTVYFQSVQSLTQGGEVYVSDRLFTGLGYPPFSLLPFLPLTIFSESVAQALFLTFSILAIPVTVASSFRLFGEKVSWRRIGLAAILVYWSFPTRFTLGMGQSNLVALAFLVTGAALKSWRCGSLAVAVSLLFKPHFVLLLPFLYLSGRKNQAAVAGLIVAAIAALSYFFRPDLWTHYLLTEAPALVVYRGREIYYNQGVGAVFARMLPVSAAAAATQITSLLVYSFAVFSSIKYPKGAMILGLPAFLMVEPLSWQHHYVFLIPVFVWWLVSFRHRFRAPEFFWVGLAYLLISLNLKTAVSTPPHWLFASHVFWGTLILAVLSWRKLRYEENG